MKAFFNYIIVEDEPLQVENLLDILNDRLELKNIGVFNTAMDAYQFLSSSKGSQTDIVFLDIQMPEQNGLSLLKSLQNLDINPSPIIISAHEEYAIEGYHYDVAGYIVKPVIPQKLFRTIDRVLQQRRESPDIESPNVHTDYAILKIKKKEIKVFFKEILFCESTGNDVQLTTLTGIHQLRGTLKELEKQLSYPPFMRIHNGFIVNLDYMIGHENHIKVLLRYDIHSDTYEIPVGGKYRDTLKMHLQ